MLMLVLVLVLMVVMVLLTLILLDDETFIGEILWRRVEARQVAGESWWNFYLNVNFAFVFIFPGLPT